MHSYIKICIPILILFVFLSIFLIRFYYKTNEQLNFKILSKDKMKIVNKYKTIYEDKMKNYIYYLNKKNSYEKTIDDDNTDFNTKIEIRTNLENSTNKLNLIKYFLDNLKAELDILDKYIKEKNIILVEQKYNNILKIDIYVLEELFIDLENIFNTIVIVK